MYNSCINYQLSWLELCVEDGIHVSEWRVPGEGFPPVLPQDPDGERPARGLQDQVEGHSHGRQYSAHLQLPVDHLYKLKKISIHVGRLCFQYHDRVSFLYPSVFDRELKTEKGYMADLYP